MNSIANFAVRTISCLLCLLAATACDNEPQEEILRLTVASERQLVTREVWGSDKPATYPVYLVKEDDAAEWRPFDHAIVGFDYTAGFEYRIEVRVEPFPDRDQIADDVPEYLYTLQRMIGIVRKDSDNLPASTVRE